MLDLFLRPETYVSLLTLTALEIVLGIDNIIFITILAGRLPAEKQLAARRLGLALALGSRLALLLSIVWVMRLVEPLFTLLGHSFTGKDLILLFGGMFLLAKATHEIYENVERPEQHQPAEMTGDDSLRVKSTRALYVSILVQIALLDVVFSLDSVITAVGMVKADEWPIMVAAVLVSVAVMMAFARPIGDFVQRHASIRVLALSFLVLIGVLLIGEGMGQHFSKGYVYFAMAFSLAIELVNMRMRSRKARIQEALDEAAEEATQQGE